MANSSTPIVTLATASPYKFSVDVLDALSKVASDEWDALKKLSAHCQDPIPVNLAQLESMDILHSDVISVEEMKEVVEKGLGEVR